MKWLTGRRGRRGLVFSGIGIAALALAGVAFAFWTSTDSSNPAVAVADSIQAGSTPTLGGINGQDVNLNWTATTTVAGASVSGYTVNRYSVASGGTPTAATGGCTGTIAALTCTEQSVPAGTWYYAITPKISLWSGAESGRLSTTVVAASFSVTASQQVRATANVTGGSIAHFNNSETVVFHLDTAAGTTMTGGVSAVNSSGSASGFTVTVPAGTAQGSHTIVAVGGSGSQATSNSFNVDNTAPVTTDNTASIGSGWFNTTKTVTLTPTDSGGAGVAATYYTTDGSTPTISSSQGTSIVLSTDGVYTIKYFSVDNAGNTEAVVTAGTAIHIDKTSPTAATLSVPTFVKNGQVLTNAATDPTVNGASSGVASVAYYYCSGASCTPNTLIGSSSTGPNFSVTWSSMPADATYRVQAVATDNASNTGSSNIVSTTVDNTGPSGGSVTYTNAYFTAASISVTFSNGTDSGSGINAATTQLQRASAALSNGSCGAFGSFTNIGSAAPTSPYADSSVLSGNCYQYQYLVSDNVGNVKTYTSASVAKVDTTGPTLTVTYTGPNVYATGMTAYFKNGGSGSFTVTAADPESGISSSTFPAAPAGWSVSGSGNARTYTLGAASASSSITVSTTNGAGTGSGNQTVTITLDNTPPSVTAGAMGPTDNTTTPQFIRQGGQYYVYVTATDAGSGIASTVTDVSQVSTGQTAVPGVLGSYPAFGTTYNYRTAAITASNPVAAGAKTFSGTLTDNVGNSVMPGTLPVTVDNTNPTGSITAPSNGWATASTTVTSNSADATAGVFTAQFQYSVHNANSWTTIATDTSSPWQASWNTTGLTDGGSYDLRVITEDNASNTFTSPTVTVTVDRTAPAAPSTPLLSAGSDTGVQGDNTTTVTTPTFTGTAEAGSTVTLYDGGNQVGSGTAAGGSYSITSSALVLGAHSISATATDAAGNVSASSGVRTVTIVAPLTVTSIATSNVSGGTAGHAELGDTFSVTFNNALDPTTVDTAHVQTITLSGAGGSTTITMTGLSAASGFTVPSTYEKSGNSSAANGSLSLSNGNKTVTFTISGAFSNSGNVKTGTAGTFNFPPLATIADTYGDASAATYSQGSALLLF